jgi:hypothetical protein
MEKNHASFPGQYSSCRAKLAPKATGFFFKAASLILTEVQVGPLVVILWFCVQREIPTQL